MKKVHFRVKKIDFLKNAIVNEVPLMKKSSEIMSQKIRDASINASSELGQSFSILTRISKMPRTILMRSLKLWFMQFWCYNDRKSYIPFQKRVISNRNNNTKFSNSFRNIKCNIYYGVLLLKLLKIL